MIAQIIFKLAKTSSKKEKVKIAKGIKGKEIAEQVVYHALNPYWTYGIEPQEADDITTLAHAKKIDAALEEQWQDVRVLLNKMLDRELTGNAAREALRDPAFETIAPIVQRILKKDLRCGAHVSTINAAFGMKWLPTFDVALADEGFVVIDGTIDKSTDVLYPIWAEPKYDGIRCSAVFDPSENVDGTSLKLFSRTGKEFDNFPNIHQAIFGHQAFAGLMLDGEVFGDTFDAATTVAHTKSGKDDSALTYRVWDCMRVDEFTQQSCERQLVERQKMLSGAIQGCDSRIQQAPGCLIQSEEHMLQVFHALREQGYEGLVLKPLDGLYSYKRSKDWVKVKAAETTEGTIIEVLPGTGKHKSVMGAVMVSVDGMKDTKVGSGFSDADRKQMWKDRKKLVGKVLEFKHMGVTPHSSFRHPVMLRLRPDKE